MVAYFVAATAMLGAWAIVDDRQVGAGASLLALASASAAMGRPRSLGGALGVDVLVSLGLWWLYGPVVGADFLLFAAVAVGSFLLTRPRALAVTAAAVGVSIAEIALHFLADDRELSLFHAANPIPVTQFVASVGVKVVLLLILSGLFLTLAGMLRRGLEAMAADLDRQQELVRLKDQFVATVSHELRTPLTSLKGFSEAMLDSEFPREEQVEFLSVMRQQADELHGLVEDLITFSQAEAGALTVAPELVDPAIEVGKVLDYFGDHTVSVRAQPGAKVLADPLRLRQVLRNLLDNAFKYGHRVRLDVSEEGQDVVFRIQDDGPGVPPDLVDQIFKPYGRLVDDRTMSKPGIGLGLPLARILAERQGGTLDYVAGSGATFELRLPSVEALT